MGIGRSVAVQGEDVTGPSGAPGPHVACTPAATKPYKFIGFVAIDVTKPYKFIGFGAIAITKPYKFIGFEAIAITQAHDVSEFLWK